MVTPSHAIGRRQALLALAAPAVLLPGCADLGDAAAPPAAGRPEPLLQRVRMLTGGFLAPPVLQPGLPPRPGTGMFVRWLAPAALALRGQDLLVLDVASGRLWRCDLLAGTVSGIAGAPTAPGTVLALGPEGAAWVLDLQARQVLRFGRDGRLLQTLRIGTALPSPVALALADGGLTVLIGDGLGAQWQEQRAALALGNPVAPADAQGQRISGVDGLAVRQAGGSEQVWVLDRLAGVVHRVQRDGRVLGTLGRGELMQPTALGVDRHGRAFVVDRGGQALVVLQPDQPAQHLAADALGLQRIGALAVDGDQLALADPGTGQVLLQRLGWPEAT